MKHVKEASVKDLTIISRDDSMMVIYSDHLEVQDKSLEHITQFMMMWKLFLGQLGVLQQNQLINFLAVHKDLKETSGGLSMNQELNVDANKIADNYLVI